VLCGPNSSSPKNGRSPPPKKKNSAHCYCGQTAGWSKMALGMEVGVGPGHIVLDMGTHLPHRKGGGAPLPNYRPFLLWPNGSMHQDAIWYGRIGLSPGDFVLDGDPAGPAASPKRGRSPRISVPCLLRPNGCMDQDATWYRGRSWPRRHDVRRGPTSPSPTKEQSPPQFSAHFYCG